MRACLLALIVLACLPQASSGQHKLAGTFQIGACDDRPAWSSFTTIADTDDLHAAADCSRRTGMRWVLYLRASQYHPVTAHAVAVKARVDAAGLGPYLIAIADHEEWYEQVLAGALPYVTTDPAVIVPVVHAWAGKRNAEIKAVFPGVPILWITTLVNDSPAYGLWLWRPLPAGVDAIALEGYVPAGLTWAQTAGRYLAHAIATRPEPIVLITQGFSADYDPQWQAGPTPEVFAATEQALLHPRVIASWLFSWDAALLGRGFVAVKQRPDWQQAYAAAIGARE